MDESNGYFAIAFRGRFYIYTTNYHKLPHTTLAANIVNSIPEGQAALQGKATSTLTN
jgi:hypothetical protein